MDKLLFVYLFVRCFPPLRVFKFSEVYLKTPPQSVITKYRYKLNHMTINQIVNPSNNQHIMHIMHSERESSKVPEYHHSGRDADVRGTTFQIGRGQGKGDMLPGS